MAERLDMATLPPRRGAPTKYPWDEWLDGSVWKITGEDIPPTSNLASVRQQAWYTARQRGKRIVTQMHDGYLLLQALKP